MLQLNCQQTFPEFETSHSTSYDVRQNTDPLVITSEERHESLQQHSSPRANVLQLNMSQTCTSVLTTKPSTTALEESTDEGRKVVKLNVSEKTNSLITKSSIQTAEDNTEGRNVSNFNTLQPPAGLRGTPTSNNHEQVNDPERITVAKRMEQKATSVMTTKPAIHPPHQNPLQRRNNRNLKNSQTPPPGQNTPSKENTDNLNVLQKQSPEIKTKLSIHPPQGNPAQKKTLPDFNGSETAAALMTTPPSSLTAQQIGSGTQSVLMRSRQTTDETFPNREEMIDLSQLSPDGIHGEDFEEVDEGDDSHFADDYYDQSNNTDEDILVSKHSKSKYICFISYLYPSC